MKRILFCCAAGMSTSLLVTKMQKASEAMGIESKIWAIGAESVGGHVGEADVILLGPQIRFKLNDMKKIGEEAGIPVEVINTTEYGLLKGDRVFKRALDLIEGK